MFLISKSKKAAQNVWISTNDCQICGFWVINDFWFRFYKQLYTYSFWLILISTCSEMVVKLSAMSESFLYYSKHMCQNVFASSGDVYKRREGTDLCGTPFIALTCFVLPLQAHEVNYTVSKAATIKDNNRFDIFDPFNHLILRCTLIHRTDTAVLLLFITA